MDEMKSAFDRSFSGTERLYGDQPIPIVTESLKYISSGKVLDLGAGDGRNALYLAGKRPVPLAGFTA